MRDEIDIEVPDAPLGPGVSLRTGLWSMKSVYFLYYVATAVYVTFVSLYLHAIHLSGAQIGLVSSIVPLAGVALQPVWALLSDRFHMRKRVLVLGLLAASVGAGCVSLAHSFVVVVILFAMLAVAVSPVIPLADATSLEWLSRHGGAYGSVRVYGSLGFILGSVAVGPILGGGRLKLLFPLYGALLACTFLISLTAPAQREADAIAKRGGFRLVLGDRVVVLFLVLTGIGFGTSAAYNTFFALYMRELGATTAIIGLAAGIASLSELPVMALSGRIIARVGVKPLLLIGFSAAALRWMAYGVIHDFRIILVFQLLHGLTFAASYVAGVTFMDLHVPPQLRSTGQTLFYSATFGLGAVAGANIFGRLFDRLDAHGMFFVAGLTCTCVVLAMTVLIPNRHVPETAT